MRKPTSVRSNVYVYRLMPDGTKGPLIRVEDCDGRTIKKLTRRLKGGRV